MNTTILNREFQHPADGWYQIEAMGEHPNRPAQVVQVIDGDAAGAIVNRFNQDAAAGRLRHGNEMLIDHEHFSDNPEKESRAYGWLQELQNRSDGIYGRIRWTKTGKEAVDGGDYRFFSTEYAPADLKVLNAAPGRGDGTSPPLTLKRVRPVRLDGLSLTNMNNNRGQKPITNRDEFRQGRGAEAGIDTNNNQRTQMKLVASKLGLSAEASEETILAEVTKVMNRAVTAEGQVAPLTARVTELETSNTVLLGEQIDADLATAGITDEKIINRHKPLLQDPKHFKNREERVAFIGDLVKPAGQQQTQRKLQNRDAKAPVEGVAAGADEKSRVAKADTEIEDYRIKNRCSYSDARNVLRRLKPELFNSPQGAS